MAAIDLTRSRSLPNQPVASCAPFWANVQHHCFPSKPFSSTTIDLFKFSFHSHVSFGSSINRIIYLLITHLISLPIPYLHNPEGHPAFKTSLHSSRLSYAHALFIYPTVFCIITDRSTSFTLYITSCTYLY